MFGKTERKEQLERTRKKREKKKKKKKKGRREITPNMKAKSRKEILKEKHNQGGNISQEKKNSQILNKKFSIRTEF